MHPNATAPLVTQTSNNRRVSTGKFDQGINFQTCVDEDLMAPPLLLTGGNSSKKFESFMNGQDEEDDFYDAKGDQETL
jgi:hypothetical protein